MSDAILPGVVCCAHGWWEACRELGLNACTIRRHSAPVDALPRSGTLSQSDLRGEELVDQRLGFLEVRRVETFREPVVDGREEVVRLLSFVPPGQQ